MRIGGDNHNLVGAGKGTPYSAAETYMAVKFAFRLKFSGCQDAFFGKAGAAITRFSAALIEHISKRVTDPDQGHRLGMQPTVIQSHQDVGRYHQVRQLGPGAYLDAHRGISNVERRAFWRLKAGV